MFINVKNKSHTITAGVEIPPQGANGVLLAQAGRFGGWSLYLQDGRPTYTYNWLGLQRRNETNSQGAMHMIRRIRLTMALAVLISTIMGSAFAQHAPLTQPAQAPLAPGQRLGITSVPNLRDVGGYTTRDGAVVHRALVYRSNQLNPISPDDLKKMAQLGLKNDFDLRTAEERTARPDELPAGVKNVWLNVLADADQSGPAQLEKLLHNPKEANVALGDGKVEAMFIKGYREFISLPSAQQAYRQLSGSLGQQDQLPALFHCTTGKDRTGWAAAALLTLLGVPQDTVVEDLLRSNDYILPAYKTTIDAFVAAGGERAIPVAIFGVKPEYLHASFDEMQKRYGTIETYFSEGLGIDAAGQQALRDLYLEKH